MASFEEEYKKLNPAQRQAVDALDGPVLVIAGPGTGKTQLLSARVAQILRKTDALAQNVLCLTFTESGAQNMRDRLTQFIGKDAYDVAISTYHAFGGDLIRRYPEYFTETRLERPVDELGKRQLLSAIVDNLSYRSPLKQTRHHLGDLMSTISEVKRGLLTPDDLRAIAASNAVVIKTTAPKIAHILASHTKRLPSKLSESEPLFNAILHELLSSVGTAHPPFENLARLAAQQLEISLNEAKEIGKSTPLTKWKNTWLAKDSENQYVLAGRLEAERMAELASLLEVYTTELANRGLYDFDDMILRSIAALETNLELKYSLQEKYQYILLDEFQDTNAAQLRLVELLTDNPANEGRPQVLAVGDDDQAIYAFQGAQYSNMLDYFHLFKDVLVINLSENYRSTADILATARNIADQVTDTLVASFPELDKTLVAANHSLPRTVLERTECASEVAERAGVADAIRQLIEQGVNPKEIAVLAPKHRFLEPLVPYLKEVPLRYERRENILEAPVIRQLLTMSKLVLALHDRNQRLADSYWPEVLSYGFWGFPISAIWNLSWVAQAEHKSWSELLIDNPKFRPAALLFLSLASQIETQTLEVLLDKLIGTDEVATGETDMPRVRSPLRDQLTEAGEGELYQAVTELTVLRARLHEHQLQQGSRLSLADMVAFVAEYEAAEEQMLNTSPYNEAADAVQLMTVFKAKGLEFEHVFLLHCQDNVWGNSAQGNTNKLTLPANLAPIRHAGSTEDERLRIFFVALTRARYGLHLSSHASTYAGKKPAHLKFLIESETDDGIVTSQVLPAAYAAVQTDATTALPLAALETNWQSSHMVLDAPLRELLRERLDRYQLSPTHLTTFIDLEHAGPQSFLLQTLLKFPTAPTVDLAFGNAMHETLEWLQLGFQKTGKLPSSSQSAEFLNNCLQQQSMTGEQHAVQQARGEHALQAYLQDASTRFFKSDKAEYNFRDEGVLIGDVHLGGKIDLLQINTEAKQISIVDYKTGALGKDPAKLHRYELQLYCYKLLVEGSHTFRGYSVEQGSLVFVEPDSTGKIVRHTLTFKADETERVKLLLAAMWRHVRELQMPDISGYSTSFTAIKQFEQDLIDGKI